MPAVSTTVRSTKKEGLAFFGENGTLVLTRAGWEVIPCRCRKRGTHGSCPLQKRRRQRLVQPCRKFPELHQKPRIAQSRYRYRCTCSQDVAPANISCRLQRKCVGTMPTACLSVIMRQQHYQRLTIAPHGNYPNCKGKNIISRKTLNIF